MISIKNMVWGLSLFFTISSCFSACGNSTPVVKPDKKPDNQGLPQIKPDNKSDNKPETNVLTDFAHEDRSINSLSEMALMDFRSSCHISMIELAYGHYHDAYSEMPSNPADLLNGFMFVWPGNVYGEGPVKALDLPPDPSNPSDRGHIYYNRINAHEATIQYVQLDRENSAEGAPVWELGEREVYSDTARYALNPDDWKKTTSGMIGRQIADYSSEERYRYGCRKNLAQSISFMLDDALWRINKLDDSFDNVLLEGRYYVSERGYNTLKDAVKKGDIYFTMGKFDVSSAFYNCMDPAEDRKPVCKKFDPYKGEYGQIEINRNCQGLDKNPITIFSSAHIFDLTIPESLIITKDDVK